MDVRKLGLGMKKMILTIYFNDLHYSGNDSLTIESSRKLQPRISAVSTMLLSGLQVATSKASYNEAAKQTGFNPTIMHYN